MLLLDPVVKIQKSGEIILRHMDTSSLVKKEDYVIFVGEYIAAKGKNVKNQDFSNLLMRGNLNKIETFILNATKDEHIEESNIF